MAAYVATDHIHSTPVKKPRFILLTKEEIYKLVLGKDSQKTKDVINYSMNILKSYCQTADTTISDLENLSREELCSFLRKFYAGVRQTNSELYASKSFDRGVL